MASSAISGTEETTWFTNKTASPALLVTGTNVLAVEVHQGSTSSSDLGFNFLLVAQLGAGPATPIPLVLHRTATDLDLAWPANQAWNLYSSPTVGPGSLWTRVAATPSTADGQTTISISATQMMRFFQLRQP